MIRQAGPQDTARVIELVRTYSSYDGIDFDEAKVPPAIERLLADPSLGFIFVVENDGRLVGHATATFGFDVEFGGRFVLLTELFIEERHRGAGYGGKLVEAVAQAAKQAGAHTIEGQVLQGNERAKGFYRTRGFRFPDRLVMTRPL